MSADANIKTVVAAYEAGDKSYVEIGQQFQVGESSVQRWVHQLRDRGTLEPRRKGGGTPSAIGGDELDELITKLGDANAGEITAEYNRRRRGKNRVHVSSIKRALHRHGYVVKKSAFVRWSSSAPTSRGSAPRS